MKVRKRAQQAWRSLRPASQPQARLSVIVPVYNVEPYLGECLDSLTAQTYRDLEVILVDDGSTDGSAAIAESYVERYPNMRLVSTDNHGLGAARNRGVQESQGELLAFVDSDDTVPPDAFKGMVEVLDQSGSDFVVGALMRSFGGRYVVPPWQQHLHRRRRLKLTIDDFPEMLADVFACNKVFRRAFWDRAHLAFPVGTRYEDQVTLTRAYMTADAFDVIIRIVYRWRFRDDNTSITQRRHELDDLRERFQVKKESLEIVQRLGRPGVLRTFFLYALALDLPQYFKHIPDCDDRYWRLLHTEVRGLYGQGHSIALAAMPVEHRVVGWLVVHDRREEAETILAFAAKHRRGLPTSVQNEHVVAKLPYWDAPSSGIPAALFRLHEHEPLAPARWEASAGARRRS